MGNPQEAARVGPATEQSQREILLAQELRIELDALLGGSDFRPFDFTGRRFYVANPTSAIITLFTKEGAPVCGVIEGFLLDSQKWPTPKWTPTSASIFKIADKYTIEVRGHGDLEWDRHYGVRLVLDGTYPRVDWIVPEDSQAAAIEEKRRDPVSFAYRFHPTDPTREVMIPVRDSCLRPRTERLNYGKFLTARIKAADSGAEILP